MKFKLKYSNLSLIIILSFLIFSSCQDINFKFSLNRLEEYCLSEYIHEKTLVIYNVSSTSNKTKYAQYFYGELRINRVMKDYKFPFITDKTGDYELCITNYDHILIEVNFSLKYGIGAKDFSSISKKKDLKPIEFIVENLEDKARDISKIITFEHNKYKWIENLLDELSNKIIIFSFCIISCMVFVSILEMIFLKKFMKKRKLI